MFSCCTRTPLRRHSSTIDTSIVLLSGVGSWQPRPPSDAASEDSLAAAMAAGKQEAERRMAVEFSRVERAVERSRASAGQQHRSPSSGAPAARKSEVLLAWGTYGMSSERASLDMQLDDENEPPPRKRTSLDMERDARQDEPPRKRTSVERKSLVDAAPSDAACYTMSDYMHFDDQDDDTPPRKRKSVERRPLIDGTLPLDTESDEPEPLRDTQDGRAAGPSASRRAKPSKVLHSRHATRIPGALRLRNSLERAAQQHRHSDRRSAAAASKRLSLTEASNHTAQYV